MEGHTDLRSSRRAEDPGINKKLLVLVAAAVLLCAATARAGSDDPRQEQIHAFFDRWERAVEALDVDEVMRLYAKDFLQWGMTKRIHEILYTSQFQSIREHDGKLEISLKVRDVRLTALNENTHLANVELVIAREEIWDDDHRYIDHIFMPMRLRRTEDEGWKLIGDSSRTLPLAQVGHNGEDDVVILTAESAYPTFPFRSVVEGPGIDQVTLKHMNFDITGRPYLTASLFLSRRPEVGEVYTFRTPYPDGVEHLKVPVRSVVTEVPEIIRPRHDFDVTAWPVEVVWTDVSERIENFNCYEVHVRRAEDHERVYLYRSIPPGRTSVLLGETEEQREVFGVPHTPYLIEVYAYDIYSNFAYSSRRIYNMVEVAKELQAPKEDEAAAAAEKAQDGAEGAE